MVRMRIALALCAGLMAAPMAGCASVQGLVSAATQLATLNVDQPVTPIVRERFHLTYRLFLTAAVEYRSLPQCRASQTATIAEPCYRRAVVVRLQALDLKAKRALANLDAWAVRNPTLNGAAVIDAAKSAFSEWQSIFQSEGIRVPAAVI